MGALEAGFTTPGPPEGHVSYYHTSHVGIGPETKYGDKHEMPVLVRLNHTAPLNQAFVSFGSLLLTFCGTVGRDLYTSNKSVEYVAGREALLSWVELPHQDF